MMSTKKYLCYVLVVLIFFALFSGGCGGGSGSNSSSSPTKDNQTQEETTNPTNPNEPDYNSEESYSVNGTWEVIDATFKDITQNKTSKILSANPSVINFKAQKGDNGLYALIAFDETSERIVLHIAYSQIGTGLDEDSYIDLSRPMMKENEEIEYGFEHPSENIFTGTYEDIDPLEQLVKTINTVTISDDGQSMQWHFEDEVYDKNQNKFEFTEDIYFVRVN